MASWILWFALLSVLSLGLGGYACSRTSRWPALDRVAASLLPGALVSVATLFAGCLGWMLSFFFNYPRLAPSVALWFGYDLYYGPNNGPILNTIYAPVTAIVYLPSGFGHDPTSAMAIAFAVNLVLFLIPIACFLARASSGNRRLDARLGWAFVFFVAASVAYEPSRCLLEWAHADAPALSFGALACFFVYRIRAENDWANLLACSFSAVMAVWSKQVAVPILVALPLFLYCLFGKRCLGRCLICLLASGLTVSCLFLLVFGPGEMLFNIWTIPAGHPFSVRGVGWLGIGWQLAMAVAPMLCLIAFVVLIDAEGFAEQARPLRAWLQENRWAVLLFVGLCMVPTSLVGRAKVGGDDNAFHVVYYLILAATVLLAESAVRRPSERTRRTAVLILMLGSLVHFVFAAPTLKHVALLKHPHANVEQVAFEFAKKHPESAYFPRCPLATLLAESRLYHFDGGVYDRSLAGFRPSDQHFRAALPAQLEYVAFTPDVPGGDPFMMAFLPEYDRPVTLEELPGWTVFTTAKE